MNNNKQNIFDAFSKSISSYDDYAIVQHNISELLLKELYFVINEKKLNKVLEIGFGTGYLTKKLIELFNINKIYLNEVDQKFLTKSLIEFIKSKKLPYDAVIGDIELLDLHPNKYDLIISSSVFHWLNDLESLLIKINKALVKDGILAFSNFTLNNFCELNFLENNLNYLSKIELETKLQTAGFKIIFSKEYSEKLFFNEFIDLLRYFKYLGINRLPGANSKSIFNYKKNYPKNKFGNYELTYNYVIIIAKLNVIIN